MIQHSLVICNVYHILMFSSSKTKKKHYHTITLRVDSVVVLHIQSNTQIHWMARDSGSCTDQNQLQWPSRIRPTQKCIHFECSVCVYSCLFTDDDRTIGCVSILMYMLERIQKSHTINGLLYKHLLPVLFGMQRWFGCIKKVKAHTRFVYNKFTIAESIMSYATQPVYILIAISFS